MEWLLQTFPFLADIDSSTYVSIAVYCSWACYILWSRLENAAWLVLLGPLFYILAVSAYGTFMYYELFNPKQHREWIVFVVTAAATGCGIGIALIGVVRRIQEWAIEGQYNKQLEMRAEEERTASEQQQRAMSSAQKA